MLRRKVVLYIAMSLDGYIATENGDISFLSAVERAGEDYGYADFVKTVDTVILGSRSYEKILSFGVEFPHKGRKCYVLSRSRTGHDENVEYFGGDVARLLSSIRATAGLDIFVDGGSEIVFELMRHDLIDRYIVSIIPVMLGAGIRLFKSGGREQRLKLLRCSTFPSGLVQLWYDRE
jgi:dihydrofolate reductase